MPSGFGQVAFGRCEFGQTKSDIEPRFFDSNPADGGSGIPVLFVSARTDIYGFSSRVQTVEIQISEDGGAFVDAYKDGAFVDPYDAPDSFVDLHQADPQVASIRIQKRVPWDEEIDVVIRVTAYDEFGQGGTKEAPVVWG